MNYLHSEFYLTPNQTVRVTLDKQANVKLLDDQNFSAYRHGGRHTYYGGLVRRSPFFVSPPHSGNWHVVVDLGGYAGSVRAAVDVV